MFFRVLHSSSRCGSWLWKLLNLKVKGVSSQLDLVDYASDGIDHSPVVRSSSGQEGYTGKQSLGTRSGLKQLRYLLMKSHCIFFEYGVFPTPILSLFSYNKVRSIVRSLNVKPFQSLTSGSILSVFSALLIASTQLDWSIIPVLHWSARCSFTSSVWPPWLTLEACSWLLPCSLWWT